MKELLGLGIQPDILLCRCDRPIPDGARKKIALFCNLREAAGHPGARRRHDLRRCPTPITPRASTARSARISASTRREPDLDALERHRRPHPPARGRGLDRHRRQIHASADSYKSLAEALTHGGIANNVHVKLDWIDSEIFEQPDAVQQLEGVHGILVPGGFGERGAEGKIEAARFARERRVPYFGICFGMQMAVIEAARHLAGLHGAGSTEFGPCARSGGSA